MTNEYRRGQKASRTMTVTAEHVRAYAEMTGDYNPLHFDEAFVVAHEVRTTGRAGRADDRNPSRARGDGHARAGYGVPEPELEVHRAGLHRRHDHGGSNGPERACVEAGDAALDAVTRLDGERVLEGEAWCYTFDGTA